MSENSNKGKIDIIIEDYLLSRKYDLSPIDCEHPLWQNISKKTKIYVGKNDENLVYDCVDTYLNCAGVVFDDHSKNFHIFPNNKDDLHWLNAEYSKIQNLIWKEIRKEQYSWLKDFKISKGNNSFPRMNNIEKADTNLKTDNEITADDVKIFNTYVSIDYNNSCYCLHLMRLTCSETGEVGCTMRSIQFHKQIHLKNKKGEYVKGLLDINKDKDGRFDICYPQTDKDIRQSSITSDYHKENNAGNVCFNPPISLPNKNFILNDKTLKEIINWFIYFIEKEGRKEDMTLDKYEKWKMQQVKNNF